MTVRIDPRTLRAATLIALSLAAGSTVIAASSAEWIWCEESGSRSARAHFRRTFEAPPRFRRATLRVVTDFADAVMFLNGRRVAAASSHGHLCEVDVTADIRPGGNLLAALGEATAGPAALSIRLLLESSGEAQDTVIASDRSWLTRSSAGPGWETPAYQPDKWAAAISYGALAAYPWGEGREEVAITGFDDYHQWKQALGARSGVAPAEFFVRPGFAIRLVRSARPAEGSWVSLAIDPEGRLLIGREDRGILRLTLPEREDGEVHVETVNDTLKECRGLLLVGDALYANANESKGLYRLRDTTGDGRFDEVELLYRSGGGTGHGRNDLALGPDGKLYVIHGDAVDVPLDCSDATSPFRERRPRKRSREGHVYRIALDGSERELVASGLRNPYGIDFNADGEMFTYDADAEYDMGSPWYRPTRVNHIVRGADYGWRGVTGSWPPYYPDHADNAPHNLDIGKGSPTSIKFGRRSRFPPPYRRALFILDWAYGRVLAVHMTPRGASYGMSAETFLKGRPLNVTDLDFAPDGSMYLITGGRKTSSALYRITYEGEERTEVPLTRQQRERHRWSAEARELRRALETFHGREDAHAVDFAWPHLDSPDPWIRHAARIAIEHQPVASWKPRALAEERPRAALTALLALARSRPAEEGGAAILTRLRKFPLERLDAREQEIALGTYSLCLLSASVPDMDVASRARITKALDAAYPADTATVNRQLSRLLAHLGAPSVVPKTLARIETTTRQAEILHYLFVLRTVRDGWNADRRLAYFRALRQMDRFYGGAGLPTFIETIRSEAKSTLTPEERDLVAPLLEANEPATSSVPPLPPLAPRDPSRDFVKKWTLADFSDALDTTNRDRDLERGREVFHAALCVRCHRAGGEGSAFGPDLTSVSSRFTRRDLLDSILRPSNVVADTYRNVTLVTKHGAVLAGRLVLRGDYRRSVIRIVEDPLRPHRITTVPKPDVISYRPSAVSAMPEGLLDTFAREEILDLLAYLEAGGAGG